MTKRSIYCSGQPVVFEQKGTARIVGAYRGLSVPNTPRIICRCLPRLACVPPTTGLPVVCVVVSSGQPYGDNSSNNSHQAGQYPSPYQARYRLHSKHGSRSYKRRANASAGGDGGSSTFGGGGAGVGLGQSSASSRGKAERDRFLVDINNVGQRSGAAANPLLHARKNVRDVCSFVFNFQLWTRFVTFGHKKRFLQ